MRKLIDIITESFTVDWDGAWITPEGQVVDLDPDNEYGGVHHSHVLDDYFPELDDIFDNECDGDAEVYHEVSINYALNKGWLRIRLWRPTQEFNVQMTKKPTRASLAALRNYIADRNFKTFFLDHEEGSEGGRGSGFRCETPEELMREIMRRYYGDRALKEFMTPGGDLQFYQDEEDKRLIGHEFTIDGRRFEVLFLDEGDGEFYMSFSGENERGKQVAALLGHNKPYKVFSAVIASMLDIVKRRSPNLIWFKVDDSEEKRVSTYDRMLDAAEKRGLLPPGYVWDRDGNNKYTIFKKGYQ